MKLALHRSITFWSGLLVIAFITWAWQDSMHHNSHFEWRTFGGNNAGGGAALGRITDIYGLKGPPSPHPTGDRDELSRDDGIEVPAFPSPLLLRGGGQNLDSFLEERIHERRRPKTHRDQFKIWMAHQAPGDWLIFIPHWLIFLAVALPWTALLLWRARRRKRAGGLAQSHSPVPH